MQFDTHSFFNKGFTWGFVPNEIAEICRETIEETNFIGDETPYADWNKLPFFEDDDKFFYEIIREKMTMSRTPSEIKYIAEKLIENEWFDPLRKRLVKPQHQEYTWMRSIIPNGFGLWNKSEFLDWHNDTNDGNHLLILCYFNDKTPKGGTIRVGVEDEHGKIECVHSHPPLDQTMICINNMNPYFYHTVEECLEDRFVLSFRYRFV